MTITGIALLALCTLLGQSLGALLGAALGVKANIGGVGIAMLLVIISRYWLIQRGMLSEPAKRGLGFWASLYIPIVVAMAAQQDVVAAADGGPMVLIAAAGGVTVCFAAVATISRVLPAGETMDEIEAREHAEPGFVARVE